MRHFAIVDWAGGLRRPIALSQGGRDRFSSWKLRATWLVAGALASLGSSSALADPAFGSYGDESGALHLMGGQGSVPVNDKQSYVTPGGMQPVTSLPMPTLQSLINMSSNGTLSAHGSFGTTGNIDGGQLHGSTSATGDNVSTCENHFCTNASASSTLYELWIDHLTVTAPVGVTAVQVTYTTFFEGTYLASGGTYVLDNYGQPIGPTEANFHSNVADLLSQKTRLDVFDHIYTGDGSFKDSVTHTMTVTPGVPFEIELQMNLQSYAGMPFGPSLSQIHAMNTGGIYFGVSTPGAEITSASGVSYDVPAVAVPEASSWVTMLLGLVAVTGVVRRQRLGSV